MYQEPELLDTEHQGVARRLKSIACLLVIVMLCGVVSGPIAIVAYWYTSRDESRSIEVTPAENVNTTSAGFVNRIAFIDSNRQLATIAPDGSTPRQLTDLEDTFQFPAWAPDGHQLAVIGEESVYAAADLAGTALLNLYQSGAEPPFYLYWSPDSRQLSFLANHPEAGIALHLAEVNGVAPASRLLLTGQPLYWDWTPDGKQLFVHTGFTGEDARLAVVDSTGDVGRTNLAMPGFFQAPGNASSGRFRAFGDVDMEGNRRLVIQNADTGETAASEAHSGQVALSWNPTTDVLAYITPGIDVPVFYGPLRLLDAGAGQSRVLVQDLVVAFFWSPDGQQIAYFALPNPDEDGVQAFVKRQAKIRVQDDDALQLELWVVKADGSGRQRLARFEPTQDFAFQFLPFFDQYALSHRLWSPASDALVLPMVTDGVSRVFVLPVDGGEPELLADGTMAFWSWQ